MLGGKPAQPLSGLGGQQQTGLNFGGTTASSQPAAQSSGAPSTAAQVSKAPLGTALGSAAAQGSALGSSLSAGNVSKATSIGSTTSGLGECLLLYPFVCMTIVGQSYQIPSTAIYI